MIRMIVAKAPVKGPLLLADLIVRLADMRTTISTNAKDEAVPSQGPPQTNSEPRRRERFVNLPASLKQRRPC